MKKLILIGAWALAGCAAQQQRAVNDAYASGQQAKANAVAACAQSSRVASCMLGVAVAFGSGNSDSVPVVQSDLSAILNSSVLGAVVNVGGQIAQSNNAAKVAIAQTDASVRVAESGDARQVATMQAATGANAAIAHDAFDGYHWAVGDAFEAFGGVAQTSNQALADIAAAQTALLANAKPTTQIIAGGSITQSGRDTDQSTARNRITGDNNDAERNVNCVAQGGSGAPATGGNNSASGGATSPLTTGYNPLITGGDGAAGSNNCGN